MVLGLVTLLSVTATPAHAHPDDLRVEIVGGGQAGRAEFPWAVRLSNGCAGTLVRERHVLTAAHCVKRSGPERSIAVTAGSADAYSPHARVVRSVRVTRAAGFRSVVTGDDWAVIKLARAVNVPPVDLPSSASLDHGTFVAIGWGATREGWTARQRSLRKVSVPLVNDSKCQELYGRLGHRIVPPEMLCAGDTRVGGKDSCLGDSGGPLVRRHGTRWVQVGIVSWGVGCGRRGAPGVYTQVSHFVDEIRAALAIE